MQQQTSLSAFYEEILPTLGKRQVMVLEGLKRLETASNMMIAKSLGWSINCVTPRINELRKLCPPRVVDSGIMVCQVTGRKVHYWRCNDE